MSAIFPFDCRYAWKRRPLTLIPVAAFACVSAAAALLTGCGGGGGGSTTFASNATGAAGAAGVSDGEDEFQTDNSPYTFRSYWAETVSLKNDPARRNFTASVSLITGASGAVTGAMVFEDITRPEGRRVVATAPLTGGVNRRTGRFDVSGSYTLNGVASPVLVSGSLPGPLAFRGGMLSCLIGAHRCYSSFSAGGLDRDGFTGVISDTPDPWLRPEADALLEFETFRGLPTWKAGKLQATTADSTEHIPTKALTLSLNGVAQGATLDVGPNLRPVFVFRQLTPDNSNTREQLTAVSGRIFVVKAASDAVVLRLENVVFKNDDDGTGINQNGYKGNKVTTFTLNGVLALKDRIRP